MASRRVRRYADVSLLVETSTNAQARALCAALSASGLPAEGRPGLRSVLVTPDPGADLAALVQALTALPADSATAPPGRLVDIPVRYDGEDLPEVAGRLGLGVREVVARHSAPIYTVACLGFSRGFPYLEGLDPSLWLPRRDSPRARVPAGAVAIAADQAGIYPQAMPGGWHVLGRTDAVLFDESAEPPAMLAPGDQVRFVPLDPPAEPA
jgi:KipI family sensor histidine kinase inhibitor